MLEFRPTRPPPGRLVRLGVVLDTRNEWGRLAEIARMCDGAGIDALWVRDQLAPGEGKSRLEAWTALTLCSREAIHPRLGAVLTVSLRSPALLAAMARTLDSVIGGRLELGLSTGRIERDHLGDGLDVPESDAQSLTMERYAEII